MLNTECSKLEMIHFFRTISLRPTDRVLAISSMEDRHGCAQLLEKLNSIYGISNCEHLSGSYGKSDYTSKGFRPSENQFRWINVGENVRYNFFNAIFIYEPSKIISPVEFNDFFRELLWITCRCGHIIFFESFDKFKGLAKKSINQLKLPPFNAYPRNVIIQEACRQGISSKITIFKKRTFE